ncbi:hypothetical protein [Actinophytocola xanthii]|uniref:Gram-positive cocci surface proteins LPxTG domain-containing protein n=1 Tax=Actinophytocola xanthii TaxID=1912961 RepID=A0A1Q8CAI1_9PSEU|nr:hypothetical protein [Actinophytocola xanthii]OLF11381.1 hypothetical protein BU204_30245 [Actinophytocola xanthii]
MRSASRIVVIALAVLFLALPALPAAAAPALLDQPPPTAPSQPGSTAPTGVRLEPADTEEDRAESRRKIVMGVASVVLLGLVIWGRSVKRKKAKAG